MRKRTRFAIGAAVLLCAVLAYIYLPTLHVVTREEIYGSSVPDRITLDDNGYEYIIFDDSDDIVGIQEIVGSYTYIPRERINTPKNYQLYGAHELRLYFGSAWEYEMSISRYDNGYAIINNRLCRVKEGIGGLESALYDMGNGKEKIKW
ncbi:hypothetical protein [Butyricicoccus sp. Marseille-Q5471]|uniref:hypothetical protein n=1 Tax=Butyricicoccus sp. Marseille-Q5471 TaxID=3039493 RepID=UPI0024BD18D2|nr:hypothetical protein [Butyricicoccus sp. Marseille-Q5471]